MDAPHPLGPLEPLTAFDQFIVALLVPLPDGRTDKIPCDFRTARTHIDAHDPQHWTTHGNAAALAHAWGAGFAVGFVVTAADPWVCVDIDHALDPATGHWSQLSHDLCHALPGAVIEVSQSGHGLHAWARLAAVPAHSKKRTDIGIEAYSERRFVVLGTQQAGELAEDCPAMRDVLARYFPPREAVDHDTTAAGPCAGWSGPEDDDALIALAMRSRGAASIFGDGVSFAELWEANADALGRKWPADGRPFDASSADMSLASRLAFWTGRDAMRINRLMLRSALVREKWDRPDYLARTITQACAQVRDVYRARDDHAAATTTLAVAEPRYAVCPDDPLNTARAVIQRHYMHPDGPCLKAWHDGFYRWQSGHWVELTTPDIRARLYDFLDREGESFYRPTQSKVSNLLDALKAAAHLDSSLAAPCWIGGDENLPPSEIVACANGLLHLPSRTVQPETPRFFNSNALPFSYEPAPRAPAAWLQFLAQVWPNDAEAISTLQELFGYLLTPDTSQQKIFLIVGPKRSGKGTIARVLTEMLGAANVEGPTLSSMATPFGLQCLIGKLAAVISDARLSGRTDQKDVAENLLRISGEDRIEVARKFLPSVTLSLGVRFVLLTNELPRIADASGAMASRFVILKMSESFLGREDPGLTAKLLRELPGVLSWAVDGWHRLKERGHFIEPKSSAGAAQELADLGSPISAFVRDECQCGTGREVEVGAMFSAWRTWCARQGIERPGTQQTFGRDLAAAVPSVRVVRPRSAGERTRVYQGIALSGPQWSAVHPIAA